MAEYTPFKMKGRPMIQGTNTHSSALKQKESDINALLEKRNKLNEKEEKVESKNKKTKLGKWLQEKKLKRIDKRQEKVQEEIDENPTAQKWRKDGEKKIEQETNTLPPGTPIEEKEKTDWTKKPPKVVSPGVPSDRPDKSIMNMQDYHKDQKRRKDAGLPLTD